MENLSNGWAIVDLSDRAPYSDRKGKTIGVVDADGKQLCSYSSRSMIAKFLAKNGIECPHHHRWWKNGKTSAGSPQWRCSCGKTKTDGMRTQGAPRKERGNTMKFYGTFKKKHAYCNHPGTDQSGIEQGNFDEFPKAIVMPNGDSFDPIEEFRFSARITSGGYAVITRDSGEVRIRITIDRCSNDGFGHHGESSSVMEVRSNVPIAFNH